MKFTKRLLALVAVTAMTALSLFACSAVGEEGEVTVVVEKEDGAYEVYKADLEDVENKSAGVVGILEYLRDREYDPLELDMTDGAYGKYISAIGSIKEDLAAKKYVMVYTSLEKDFGTWEGVGALEYEGVTLKSAGVGISSMSAEKGTVILFRLEASQW